jgi:hypothetical protein
MDKNLLPPSVPHKAVQQKLIQEERAGWERTYYILGLRHRVHQTVESAPEILDGLKEEMQKVLQAIEYLNQEEELLKDHPRAKPEVAPMEDAAARPARRSVADIVAKG